MSLFNFPNSESHPFYENVDTIKKFNLGTRIKDKNGNEYIYMAGAAGVVNGSWVNMDTGDGTYVAVLLDTDTASTQLGRIAVARAAVLAANWGWFQTEGVGAGLSLTGATDAKNAFATATGGSVDDSGAGAEVLVFGAFYVSAVDEGTLLADFALSRPFMTGLTLD